MPDQPEALLGILLAAGIVYATRVSGYFIGLQFRHIARLKPVLETLPGCAMMAILIPAARNGDLREMIAMLSVVVIMWISDNVIIATVAGVIILLFGHNLIIQS